LMALVRKYDGDDSKENREALEKELLRLKNKHLYALKMDPVVSFKFHVFGDPPTPRSMIPDHHARQVAGDEILCAYKNARNGMTRSIVGRSLGLDTKISTLKYMMMEEGYPLSWEERADVYVHCTDVKARIKAGKNLGLSNAALWHSNYGRLRHLIWEKKLVGEDLISTAFGEVKRLECIISDSWRSSDIKSPEDVKEILGKIYDDEKTSRSDREFIAELFGYSRAKTLAKELDLDTLSKVELKQIYRSKDVTGEERRLAGKRLGYSDLRIWIHENPGKAAFLLPLSPVIIFDGALSLLGKIFSYKDKNEYYYGGAGWGWVDEDGKYHSGDNR
ncbi:hypothetical protein KY336_02230, partial [Candidatus Woesearchaeota archaeon]|nr:hypothetical protein [Candidatus Woesearchaeota archaeon]